MVGLDAKHLAKVSPNEQEFLSAPFPITEPRTILTDIALIFLNRPSSAKSHILAREQMFLDFLQENRFPRKVAS